MVLRGKFGQYLEVGIRSFATFLGSCTPNHCKWGEQTVND